MAEFYWQMKTAGAAAIELREGDRVKLNLETIQRHPDYPRLSERYRDFVESHQDDLFTVDYDEAHQRNPSVVCLKEDPLSWLFWTGNLIKVDSE